MILAQAYFSNLKAKSTVSMVFTVPTVDLNSNDVRDESARVCIQIPLGKRSAMQNACEPYNPYAWWIGRTPLIIRILKGCLPSAGKPKSTSSKMVVQIEVLGWQTAQ
jgi:hypothetical protein